MNAANIRRHCLRQPTASALLGIALLLGGCAATGLPAATHTAPSSATTAPSATAISTSPTTSSAAFACQIAMTAQAVDTVVTTLTCRVTGASASDTSFAVTYTVKTPTGARRYTPACSGTLSDGHGSCVARYSIPAPLGLGGGLVSGATLPDQRALGPVTPQLTPAPAPPPPFGTPWPGGFPTITPRA